LIDDKLDKLEKELEKANQLIKNGCIYEEEVQKTKKKLIYLIHFYESIKENL